MLRTEFKELVERCGCFQASQGKCNPKKCYPEIYKIAYPRGGMNIKSHLIKKVINVSKYQTAPEHNFPV